MTELAYKTSSTDGQASTRALLADAYARRAAQLWSFGRRLGLDSATAEDVMQDAFARAMAQPPGSIEEIDAWLFRVVHNLAIDRRRRRSHVLIHQTEATDGSDEIAARIALWQHVDRLPDRQRAVLYLRFRADLSFASIAQILGITEGGARANLSRGLEALRRRVTR